MTKTPAGVAAAPRLYHLHSLLAGPVSGWERHTARAAAMGFDHLLITAPFRPGTAGDPLITTEHHAAHPALLDGAASDLPALLRRAADMARAHGMRLMLDIAVQHLARQHPLVSEHPDWFDHVAGDAARLRPTDPQAQAQALHDMLKPLLAAGVHGLRLVRAHELPAAFWQTLLPRLRQSGAAYLFADTLGAPIDTAIALGRAGFDALSNSACWWDGSAPWLLAQYDALRHAGLSSISLCDAPSGLSTLNLTGADPEQIARAYRQRYLFAAAVAGGVLMPMGFEHGLRFDSADGHLRPGNWPADSTAPIDLTGFIGEVNALKKAMATLNRERLQHVVSAPDTPAAALLRFDAGHTIAADEASLLVLNFSAQHEQGLDTAPLLAALGGAVGDLLDVTPESTPLDVTAQPRLSLAPLEARLFRAQRTRRPRTAARDQQASARRLQSLAQNRVVIEKITPQIDGGRHPIKCVVGDAIAVEADIFCDGHDKINADLLYRAEDETAWRRAAMAFIDNDRWGGGFTPTRNARHRYTIEAWRDPYASWRIEVAKKVDAGKDVTLEIIEGKAILDASLESAGADAARLRETLKRLNQVKGETGRELAIMLDDDLHKLMRRSGKRLNVSRYPQELGLTVDREAAQYAAWYELMPRSMSFDVNRHGTFDDVIKMLPYVRDMGFDVLYFPPIHPIGMTNRKGKNNSLTPQPGDVGSPYAIGAEEGGHDAIHPELGDFADFARLIDAAAEHGLEVALDFAIQCSPDHPWIKQHPEWFDWRPDGTIKFAENPPKKYEDIVNVHFYRDALPSIWYELRDVVRFWIDKGVKTFRVDNPHTKPIPFWEWLIEDIQHDHPEVIFLSEAFTRPKMMRQLAKVGFTQSYSYFTWRNTKSELTEYLSELTKTESKDFMRVNFFANTPDINPVYLQNSGPPGFIVRHTLAATLSPVYGIYNGFELAEGTPVPGKEDYLNSEKYELKVWDYDRPGNIRAHVAKLNAIRRANPALKTFTNLSFYNAWNDNIVYYGKLTPARDNVVLVAVNLDPHNAQEAFFEVPLWEFGLPDHATIEVEDLLTEAPFRWTGKVQHMRLDPMSNPVHLWRLIPPGVA